ncbi:hypothetical protein DRW03_32960 [Corallococcus sp. H22C18031201]|nr:hypothetical protein DRW03_32960 [Corallococcus sp. H22C18031201]
MRLEDAQARLDCCFAGMAEGAPRLHEPSDSRFALRPSAVWLEYRWYVQGAGLAEVFLKWGRRQPAAEAEASVLRVHLLGHSPTLAACARGVLEGGVPAPEDVLDLFGDDGVRREHVLLGRTRVTVESWAAPGPNGLLDAHRFHALAAVVSGADASPEERHEAVQRLTAGERSARVVDVLLELLERVPSLMALRVLSEWGEVRSRPALRRALAAVHPDNPADLWALTALDRRLEAWARAAPGA